MENNIETLEEKLTTTIVEVTGRLSGVEKTVQDLRKEVDKLQERTLVAKTNACSNIKTVVYDGKT